MLVLISTFSSFSSFFKKTKIKFKNASDYQNRGWSCCGIVGFGVKQQQACMIQTWEGSQFPIFRRCLNKSLVKVKLMLSACSTYLLLVTKNTVAAGIFSTSCYLAADVSSLLPRGFCWGSSVSSDLDGVTQLWLQHSKMGFVLQVLSCHLDCHWQFTRNFSYTNWHTEIRFHPRDACVRIYVLWWLQCLHGTSCLQRT